jgi:hypothetical protein
MVAISIPFVDGDYVFDGIVVVDFRIRKRDMKELGLITGEL